ncbi:MAG: outer rane receptor protein [Panacagrimonas sp.]|nr:TonB-dependent receptor [Panacagrimonas sp.]MCC2656345.1 outer rane receptor protein [Panacagrimonas sp.]
MRSLDLAFLIAVGAVVPLANAQETTAAVAVESQAPAESTLDTITVTAQKREENALDVPLSVQAFSGGALAARGIEEPTDLQTVTPGLSIDEQAQFTTIFLRGVGSDAFLMADPSVAYYVDGIYFPFSQGQSQDFGSVERVEVLKGPQGTLFGRNAVGGAINVITRDPDLRKPETLIRAGYSSRDTYDTDVYQSIPIADWLAVGVSGYYRDGDHYMSGEAAGRPLSRERSRGGKAKLRFTPFDALDVILAAQRDEQTGSGSVFSLNASPTRLFSCDAPVPLPICITAQTGYDGELSEPTFIRYRNTVYYGSAHLTTDWFDVKVLGSDQRARSVFSYDFDGSAQAIAAFDQKKNLADIESAELQIVSNESTWGSEHFEWIVGGYYFHSKQGFDTANLKLLGLDLADMQPGGISLPQPAIDALDALNLAFPNGDVAFHAIIGTLSRSVFAQGTLHITDWLALTLGGRYQDEARYLIQSDSGLYQSDGSFFTLFDWMQIGARDAAGATVPVHDTTATFKPKATLELRPFAGELMVYLTWQEALKSATYNAIGIYQPPTYVDPEKLEAWELGLKTPLFDGAAALSIAAFDYDIRDFQVQFISLFQGGAVSFENADAASIRGIDFELSAQLLPEHVDDLYVTLAGAYLDSKYDDYTSASGFDPEDGTFSSDNDYSGKRVVRTPRWTAAAGLNKACKVPGGEVEIGADAYYNDGFFYASSNARNLEQDAYWVWGARVGYRYEPWRLRATLFGRNLGDEKYSQGLIATDFGANVTLAAPRTYGLQLDWSF